MMKSVLPQPAPTTLAAGNLEGQGIVELKNGATIENAIGGIRAMKEGDCCGFSGGIVRAIGGTGPEDRITFRNCRKSVELMTYKFASESRLTNCDFVCDAPMNSPAYVVDGQPLGVNSFVTIWDQQTIPFNNCTFTNSYIGSGELPQHLRGTGIGAIDATIIALGNTYTGLSRGVEVRKTTLNTRRLMHYSSEFTNVVQGILSEGSTMDLIAGNEIHVPVTDQLAAFGIFMFRGKDHKVQNNIINLHGTTPGLNWGIVNRGAKLTGGLVRGNELDQLWIGTQTESHNPYLQILCNDYLTGMEFDWVNNPFSQGSYLGPQGTGCLGNQYRAGNRFYNTNNDHIHSWAQEYMYYGSGESNTIPTVAVSAPAAVVMNCQVIEETCPEPTIHEAGDLHQVRMQMDSTIGALGDEKILIAAALDSNLTKTTTLLTHLVDTNYSNATLRNELVNWSLLTDAVLLAAQERYPAFTESQYMAIMKENLPVSWPVWQAVTTKFSVLKTENVDTLRLLQASDVNRTIAVVDREKAAAESIRFRTVNDYLEIFLDKDSITDSTYTAINYMLGLGDKEYYKLAVGTALSLDTVAWARTLLDTMSLADAEDTAFFALHDLAISLREDSLTWFTMDSLQLVLVKDIAADTTAMKGYAEAVLALLGDSSITRTPEPMPELSGRRGQEDQPTTSVAAKESDEVHVYPNPSTNVFNVEYHFEKEVRLLIFEVADVAGRKITEQVLRSTQQGKAQLDLRPCNGMYFLRVIADGKAIQNKKLVCFDR